MEKPSIAMFSPVKPVPSGISDYCKELLVLLGDSCHFHLFLDNYEPDDPFIREKFSWSRADHFAALHQKKPFDQIIYQTGNSPVHQYMYPYIYNYPGILLLHDAWLMGTRLAKAVQNWEGDQFRAEMKAAYGEEKGDSAAEIILSGLHNQQFLRYFPMIELPIMASKLTVVHDSWLAEKLERDIPGCMALTVPHRLPDPVNSEDAYIKIRKCHGLEPETLIFGCFGHQNTTKRIPQILKAFASFSKQYSNSRLMIAGSIESTLSMDKILGQSEASEKVIVTGRLSDQDFNDYMAACDAVIALRWPTRRESSGIIINAMSQGKAVIVSDLAHLKDYPENTLLRVPLVGEQQALREILLKVAQCPPLRKRIGDAARKHRDKYHSANAARKAWQHIFKSATGRSAPELKQKLPSHLFEFAN